MGLDAMSEAFPASPWNVRTRPVDNRRRPVILQTVFTFRPWIRGACLQSMTNLNVHSTPMLDAWFATVELGA